MASTTVVSTKKKASAAVPGLEKAARGVGNVAMRVSGKEVAAGAARKPAAANPVMEVKPDPNSQDIRQMIRTAAYYRAEKRGFVVGHEQEDWLMAEQEISRMLAA